MKDLLLLLVWWGVPSLIALFWLSRRPRKPKPKTALEQARARRETPTAKVHRSDAPTPQPKFSPFFDGDEHSISKTIAGVDMHYRGPKTVVRH